MVVNLNVREYLNVIILLIGIFKFVNLDSLILIYLYFRRGLLMWKKNLKWKFRIECMLRRL